MHIHSPPIRLQTMSQPAWLMYVDAYWLIKIIAKCHTMRTSLNCDGYGEAIAIYRHLVVLKSKAEGTSWYDNIIEHFMLSNLFIMMNTLAPELATVARCIIFQIKVHTWLYYIYCIDLLTCQVWSRFQLHEVIFIACVCTYTCVYIACVCVHVCMCAYVHVCMGHMHTCTLGCGQATMHSNLPSYFSVNSKQILVVCVGTCTRYEEWYTYTYTNIHVHTRTHIHTYIDNMNTHTHTYTQTYTHTHMYTHTHTQHTHKRTYTYTHIHTCTHRQTTHTHSTRMLSHWLCMWCPSACMHAHVLLSV